VPVAAVVQAVVVAEQLYSTSAVPNLFLPNLGSSQKIIWQHIFKI